MDFLKFWVLYTPNSNIIYAIFEESVSQKDRKKEARNIENTRLIYFSDQLYFFLDFIWVNSFFKLWFYLGLCFFYEISFFPSFYGFLKDFFGWSFLFWWFFYGFFWWNPVLLIMVVFFFWLDLSWFLCFVWLIFFCFGFFLWIFFIKCKLFLPPKTHFEFFLAAILNFFWQPFKKKLWNPGLLIKLWKQISLPFGI